MSKWKYKSLEWIHKVREENYRKTKNMSAKEIIQQSMKDGDAVRKKIFGGREARTPQYVDKEVR